MRVHSAGLIVCLSLSPACRATAPAGSAEPRLTNPVRFDAWLAGPAAAAADPLLGPLRAPLSSDWSFALPDDGRWALSRMELGEPAVVGSQVWTGSSRSAGLFVLNRRSGRIERRVPTDGPVQAPVVPIVTKVSAEAPETFVGVLVADTFGTVVRLDAALAPVWTEPFRAGAGVTRAPRIDGDQVLFSTTRDELISIGLADGRFRWSYKREVPRTSMELAILGAPAPVVDGDEVLAGFSDGAVVGVDRATGRLRWEAAVGEGQFPDIEAEVVVVDGVIVVGAFGGPIAGLDRNTRRVLYRLEDAGATASMDSGGGYVYAADGKGRVRCFDPVSGQVVWTWERAGKLFAGPRRAGGLVLIGDVEGTLYGLDRFDGSLEFTFRPESGTRLAGIATRPVIDGRQVLFPTAGGRLLALIGDSGLVSDRSEESSYRSDRPLGW